MKQQWLVFGCERLVVGRGFCDLHYRRFRRYGDPIKTSRPSPGTFQACRVAGCTRPHLATGLCSLHYGRNRTAGSVGESNLKISRRGEPLKWINTVALQYGSDDCLKYPFAQSGGYGQLWAAGKKYSAHRFVCEAINGLPPPGYTAAHSCGHSWCVNPRHLRWKTYAGNEADKRDHGTYFNRYRRVTEKDVLAIRVADGTHEAIAKKFGVSRRLVGMIKSRKIWAWLIDRAAA